MFIDTVKQLKNIRRLLKKKSREYIRLHAINRFSYECERCYMDVQVLSGNIKKLEAQRFDN